MIVCLCSIKIVVKRIYIRKDLSIPQSSEYSVRTSTRAPSTWLKFQVNMRIRQSFISYTIFGTGIGTKVRNDTYLRDANCNTLLKLICNALLRGNVKKPIIERNKTNYRIHYFQHMLQ